MKISNSKKELARIISENGGWRDGVEWAAQDKNGIGMYSGGKPYWCLNYKEWAANAEDGRCMFVINAHNTVSNYHQTILSREEYFHLYPAPDADGWIEWRGGECPVQRGTLVDVKYANGITNIGVSAATDKTHVDHVSGSAGSLLAKNWSAGLPMSGIIAYRLHKPERAKPEFCESVMRSIPEPTAKPTIEQLASDYRNRKDYADRKQEEADAAKTDAEAKLAELVAAGKENGLVVSVELELVITDWRDLRVGDVVFVESMTCDKNEYSIAMIGRECVVVSDGDSYPVCLMNEFTPDGESYWLGGAGDEISWRFIRRP